MTLSALGDWGRERGAGKLRWVSGALTPTQNLAIL